MKRLIPIFLSLLLLVGCDTGGQASTSDPKPESIPSSVSEPAPEVSSSEPSFIESKPEESSAPESPASSKEAEPEPDPEPESQPSASELKNIQPPPVSHGAELEDVDFSTMSKDELVALLQPILDRARYFCRFALMGDMENVEADYSSDAAILQPFRNEEEHIFYPFLNLPYKTVDELKEDMCTVFTPDNMEGDSVLARYVFGEGLTDHDGKLYFASGVDGINAGERRWELDGLKVVSAERAQLTISAPVSWGPMTETITAPLNFEVRDGYIVMDSSYFAKETS